MIADHIVNGLRVIFRRRQKPLILIVREAEVVCAVTEPGQRTIFDFPGVSDELYVIEDAQDDIQVRA